MAFEVPVLDQRHRCERVSQKLQSFLVPPVDHCHLAQTMARLTLDREEAMRSADIAGLLEPLGSFFFAVGHHEMLPHCEHCLALVPEALHLAEEFDAACLEPGDRGGSKVRSFRVHSLEVRVLECLDDPFAGAIHRLPAKLRCCKQLIHAPLPLENSLPVSGGLCRSDLLEDLHLCCNVQRLVATLLVHLPSRPLALRSAVGDEHAAQAALEILALLPTVGTAGHCFRHFLCFYHRGRHRQ
mmetsp:Transcript_30301/g.72070  ORF Transcript_30301/g.72070 Transcript_30301/m.72070 type:complete len:241 (+) Transcript_30301:700-1422(+)